MGSTPQAKAEDPGLVVVTDATTKGHADNVYELLNSCIDAANSIADLIYAETHDDPSQPCQSSLHGTLVENERLALLLKEKLERIWNRL